MEWFEGLMNDVRKGSQKGKFQGYVFKIKYKEGVLEYDKHICTWNGENKGERKILEGVKVM